MVVGCCVSLTGGLGSMGESEELCLGAIPLSFKKKKNCMFFCKIRSDMGILVHMIIK